MALSNDVLYTLLMNKDKEIMELCNTLRICHTILGNLITGDWAIEIHEKDIIEVRKTIEEVLTKGGKQ